MDMLAMLYFEKIVLGKKTFCDVPAKLRAQVEELLKENELDELIEVCE